MKQTFVYFFLLFFFSSASWAKNTKPETPPYSEKFLKKLVAPIALYPDPLLSAILPASTHPVEIVQAARIIHGEEDYSKIDSKNWDSSVKAVAHYPTILQKMNDDLEWTQALGNAVSYQEQDLLRIIQDLRRQALKAGTLQASPQQKVILSGDSIEIIPTSPELVYVPTYDSQIVYSAPPSEIVEPLISFGYGFALGSWLDTCFYWPGYAIVYGGPYYYGWAYPYPYWNRYPWAWDEWGWNHWSPRNRPSPIQVRHPSPPVPKVSGNPNQWPANPAKWNPPRSGGAPTVWRPGPQTGFPASPGSTRTVQKVSPIKKVVVIPAPAKSSPSGQNVSAPSQTPSSGKSPSTTKSSEKSPSSSSNPKSSSGGIGSASSRSVSITKGR